MGCNAGGWGTRGGGTRGREGGKWAGLDPVVPVINPDLLNSIASFYGCGGICFCSVPTANDTPLHGATSRTSKAWTDRAPT